MKTTFLVLSTIILRCCWGPSEYQLMQYAQNDDAILKTLDGKYELNQLLNEDVSEFGLNIKFDSKENKVAGFSGCNRFFGSYILNGNTLKFSPLGATRMLCSEEKNQIENKYLKALEKADNILFTKHGFSLYHKKKPLLSATKFVEESISSFEYTAKSRGKHKHIKIDKDSTYFSKNKNGKTFKKPCDVALWNSLTKMCESLDIEKISELEAPSKAFLYDGASMARLKITLKGKTYETPPFDHRNPPKAIEAIVKEILSTAQNIE